MCICDGSDLASLFDCDFWLDFIRSMQPLLEYDSDSDSFDCDSHFLCAFLWLTFSEKRFSELVGHVWLLWAPLFIYRTFIIFNFAFVFFVRWSCLSAARSQVYSDVSIISELKQHFSLFLLSLSFSSKNDGIVLIWFHFLSFVPFWSVSFNLNLIVYWLAPKWHRIL